MAEGVTVANAYVQIMPSVQGMKQNLTDSLVPEMTAAGEQGGAAMGSGILGKLSTLKGPLMAIGGTIAGALASAKIGEALLNIGGEFDEMSDAIVIGTGASGEALEALEESAKGIATSVGGSFADAGDIVQDLNTRLGLAGEDLDEVGQRVAAAGQLFGQSINVESMSGAFAAFGVETDQMAEKMDYLFGVSQSTGLGFDELTGIIERNAPALQGLGFSFEESANMAGLLDKAGMDASGMMGKMGKALVELAQPGETAADAYQRVLGEMQGYIEAGDEAAAMDLASSLFGTKGAAQFVGAVQSGALSMEELTDASLGAGEGIMGTFEATADWPERWEIIQNKAKAALEPLGGALMDGVSEALTKVSDAMDSLDPGMLEGVGTAMGDVLNVAVEGLGAALQFVIDHKDGIAEFFTTLGTAVQNVWNVIQPFATFLSSVFAGTVVPMVEGALALLSGDFEGMRDKVTNAVKNLMVTLGFPGLVDKVKGVFERVKTAITTPIENARNAIKTGLDRIKSLFSGLRLSLPHIKTPHFRISGGEPPWGLMGKGTRPTIGIDWYAKGGIVDTATLIGAGEKGPELVWPSYEPYLTKYADAIADSMGGAGASVTNVYLNDLKVNDDEAIRRDVVNLVNDLSRYNKALTAAR